jgi:D-proline reductase (dithiol) PrdB
MAHLHDIPQPTRDAVAGLVSPGFDTTPFVTGPPLARRRVAVLSSAALIRRGELPFPPGSAELRILPADTPAGDLLMSHVSINFDRAGFQRDINTVYPLDRLRELAVAGVIGGVARSHYSVMGATDPLAMAETADAVAARCRDEGVDAIVLCPV